jgi:hypothetical protein
VAAGIDFSILPASWRNCTGFCEHFASERVERYVSFPAAGYNTQSPTPFVSPILSEPLFFEARHYTDRALYHLIVGKWMVCNSRPTWGLVSFYYAAFFAAQAAIRLRGTFFVKVNYDSEKNPPPTHQLDVLNLLKNQYQIRQTSRKGGGEHQKVWAAFYQLFGSISNRNGWAKYRPVTAINGDEERLAEMHRRHLLNYVPGHGYLELRSPRDSAEWCDKLSEDLPADLARNIDDDDCQLEVRALLRLELCLQLFQKIAEEGGAYSVYHERINKHRLEYLDRFECPGVLATRLKFALAI